MKIEELVLSIEQAKHLQDLGLDMSDAALCWYKIPFKNSKWGITDITGKMRDDIGRYDYIVPTYTLQEVLGELPIAIEREGHSRNMLLYDNIADCNIWYEINTFEDAVVEFQCDTLMQAAYKMLCWVLEHGYLNNNVTNPIESFDDNIKNKVLDIVQDKLEYVDTIGNDIGMDSVLGKDVYCDSLDSIELAMELEKEFDISIPDEDIERLSNSAKVGDIAKYVCKKVKEKK